jgi:hypothetical protein
MEMMGMEKNMEISHTKSNTRGIRISVYLRREHLKTLELIGKGLETNNKSKIFQHMLEICQKAIDTYEKENPELLITMLIEETKKAMAKQFKQLPKNL